MAETALRLGTTAEGKSFTLPPDLVTQTTAILGIRGSGKTVTGSSTVEELLKVGQQVVIIDPTDVWWGLKSSADGKSEGYPVVIFGGPHGDLPLAHDAGGVIADFAVENRLPLILSLRHLRKGKQREFVTDFAEQLYHRKGETEHRTPLLVAIDEASAFVPQKVAGDTARMVGAIEDLVRRGRAAGIGVLLIDQRPASVNKDVLTQLEILIAHQITSPQDSKAIDEWIKQHDTAGYRSTFLQELPSLPKGTAWFWSPALDLFERVQVRMRETYDSSKTPSMGEEIEPPEAWAEIDLGAIREKLEDAVEEAEANDPKRLKARIAELEKELVAKPESSEPSAPSEEALARAGREAQLPLLEKIADLEVAISHRNEIIGEVVKLSGRLTQVLKPSQDPVAARPAPTPSADDEPENEFRIGGSHQKILDALAAYECFGQEEVDSGALAMLAGYRPGTGHFNNLRGAMNTAGLIQYPHPGMVALTVAGRAHAHPKPITTLQDLHSAWMEVLDGPHQRLLQVLIDIYPESISSDELAERSGYSPGTGHFNNIRGKLRTLGAIEYPHPGSVRASDLLFPEGLRR